MALTNPEIAQRLHGFPSTQAKELQKLFQQSQAGQAAHQANSAAVDVATLVTDFNALLAKLQAAGLMA